MNPAFSEFRYWLRRYRRSWRSTAVISFLNPFLFLIGIGVGLGRIVDHSGQAPIPGFSYLAFFAPGLLAASAMQIAFLESTGPVFEALHVTNTYRVVAATPARPDDILFGRMLFVVFRLLVSSTIFVGVMFALDASRSVSVLLVPLGAILTGVAFAAPGAALAAFASRMEQLQAVYRFVVMPLYLFSGTFFSASALPGPLGRLVVLSPLWQGAQMCRELSLGTATIDGMAAHILYLVVLAGVGGVVAIRLFRVELGR
jgi:lipooligosaccharide transport system permease protein